MIQLTIRIKDMFFINKTVIIPYLESYGFLSHSPHSNIYKNFRQTLKIFLDKLVKLLRFEVFWMFSTFTIYK